MNIDHITCVSLLTAAISILEDFEIESFISLRILNVDANYVYQDYILNEEGQNKLLEYSDDLISSETVPEDEEETIAIG